MYTQASGVAHYMDNDDGVCLEMIRQKFREMPWEQGVRESGSQGVREAARGSAPAKPAEGLYDLIPNDHRLPYSIEEVIERIIDHDDYLEFQPHHAPEMLCANARLSVHPFALIANRPGFLH